MMSKKLFSRTYNAENQPKSISECDRSRQKMSLAGLRIVLVPAGPINVVMIKAGNF
ncbi:MAG: hypothetical protein V7L21_25245 [Nostoc sp.]|uniref:hypothetical protein n=1 Tax=Nostoc sp. TaxID=1180 RepID=UPI002FF7C31B